MIFKAKLSPKQFFCFKGSRHTATNGFYVTDDPAIMDFLKDNRNWIPYKAEKKGSIPVETPKPEPKPDPEPADKPKAKPGRPKKK